MLYLFFRAKYQNRSIALSPAPSLYIPNGNFSLPVVVVLTGVSQLNEKGSPFCRSAVRTFSLCFSMGKTLLGVMLSVMESVWTNCTLQGFLLYYEFPFYEIFSNFSSMNLRETTKSMTLSEFFLLSNWLSGPFSLIISFVQSPFSCWAPSVSGWASRCQWVRPPW